MKKQDVVEKIEFLDFHINRLESEIRKLELSKYELQQKFGIKDVVASLLCVDSKDFDSITVGKKYELIKEFRTTFTIYDNEGDICSHEKDCFKKL